MRLLALLLLLPVLSHAATDGGSAETCWDGVWTSLGGERCPVLISSPTGDTEIVTGAADVTVVLDRAATTLYTYAQETSTPGVCPTPPSTMAEMIAGTSAADHVVTASPTAGLNTISLTGLNDVEHCVTFLAVRDGQPSVDTTTPTTYFFQSEPWNNTPGSPPLTPMIELTFESFSAGTLAKDVNYDPETVTFGQQFTVHGGNEGSVSVVSDAGNACGGTKFMRSQISGTQQRAYINWNDTAADLRARETGWTTDRPEWFIGFCVKLGGSTSAFSYPIETAATIWGNHSLDWLGDPECGPCVGLRAGTDTIRDTWVVTRETGTSSAAYDTGRDFQQDIGVWRRIVIYKKSGSSQPLKIWIDDVLLFDAATDSGGSISTFPDAATYHGYDLYGVRLAGCGAWVPTCSTHIVDRDEIRYIDASGITEQQGYDAVDPANY